MLLTADEQIDSKIGPVDKLSRSFEDGVESREGPKSSWPIESIIWQLSWVKVTDKWKVELD